MFKVYQRGKDLFLYDTKVESMHKAVTGRPSCWLCSGEPMLLTLTYYDKISTMQFLDESEDYSKMFNLIQARFLQIQRDYPAYTSCDPRPYF